MTARPRLILIVVIARERASEELGFPLAAAHPSPPLTPWGMNATVITPDGLSNCTDAAIFIRRHDPGGNICPDRVMTRPASYMTQGTGAAARALSYKPLALQEKMRCRR